MSKKYTIKQYEYGYLYRPLEVVTIKNFNHLWAAKLYRWWFYDMSMKSLHNEWDVIWRIEKH